jgi:hypothetical protein
VARRVRKWLDISPHQAVQSLWFRVQVTRKQVPDRPDAEFDILLVLKNGILLHLECKSAEIDARDMDVRTHRLQQAGSQLAKLVIVLPLYTRQADSPWFAELHAARIRAEQAGLTVLPFTWDGQPEHYLIPDSDPPKEAECLPFETTRQVNEAHG